MFPLTSGLYHIRWKKVKPAENPFPKWCHLIYSLFFPWNRCHLIYSLFFNGNHEKEFLPRKSHQKS